MLTCDRRAASRHQPARAPPVGMSGILYRNRLCVKRNIQNPREFLKPLRYNPPMSYQPVDFRCAGIRLVGLSLAGEESYVAAPELNLCFDIGRAPHEITAIDNILLSHGHMDHSAGVAYYFAQRTFVDNAPGTVFAPAGIVDPLCELVRIWADIDGREPRGIVRPAVPGERIELRRDLHVLPFTVNHATRRRDRVLVEALGFSVLEIRHKLRPEFDGLSAAQLVDLKRRGAEITRRVEVPLLSYCGDTAPGDFLDLPHVRDSKVLLLECTFVESDHADRARAGNHMHAADLKQVLPRLRNERIVLTHLSRRTSLRDARRLLEQEVGAEHLARVEFLMDARHRPRRPASSTPPRG